jgi:hypothetical protein
MTVLRTAIRELVVTTSASTRGTKLVVVERLDGGTKENTHTMTQTPKAVEGTMRETSKVRDDAMQVAGHGGRAIRRHTNDLEAVVWLEG